MVCVHPASRTTPLPVAILWLDEPCSAYACTTLEGYTRGYLEYSQMGGGQTESLRLDRMMEEEEDKKITKLVKQQKPNIIPEKRR